MTWVVVIVALLVGNGPVLTVLEYQDELQCRRGEADHRAAHMRDYPEMYRQNGFIITCMQTS